jgi:AraC family transcriptional regulator of adaptative response / DNA-3-methyladenine glycosylase II
MQLDPEVCYQAVRRRDERFDGQFFTAVVSTGIYCRPVCPAVTPKRENCRFFDSAAAAFRACRRCRPEAAPGTPAWRGTSSTVTRALRLVEQGALNGGSVEQLAGRLGVGERHLRRLFLKHLGMPPLAVARGRRVLRARKLIEETTLPMAQVALSAGFRSVRSFNSSLRREFGKTPSELRLRRKAPGTPSAKPARQVR